MNRMHWKAGLIAMMILALQLPGVAAAGGAPGFSSSPSPGSVGCSGFPGSTLRRGILFTNTGNAPLSISSCAFASGVDFQVVGDLPAPLPPGASGSVVVECHVPNDGDPAVLDTLTCTHNAPGSPASYSFSSIGTYVYPIELGVAPQIPANSVLSKLLLFGLLAGVGAAAISLRRS